MNDNDDDDEAVRGVNKTADPPPAAADCVSLIKFYPDSYGDGELFSVGSKA